MTCNSESHGVTKVFRESNDERNFWMFIMRPENLARMERAEWSFLPASSGAPISSMQPGDAIVLYKTRGASQQSPGVVATFELSGKPRIGKTKEWPMFPIQLPLKTRIEPVSSPLSLVSMVDHLDFVSNKKNYGSSLQRSMLRITKGDFETIEAALSCMS